MRHLTAPELAAWLADPQREDPVVLDVREPWETEVAGLPGTLRIPMGTLVASLSRIDRERPIVCLCHHGARSLQVAHFLERQGFDDVLNLTGGIHAWSTQVDPSVPVY